MATSLNEIDPQRGARRAGGRAARQALRAAPLAEEVRPVRPGLTGGSYRNSHGGGRRSGR
jgi:trimethylamine--corrinoid protein Co-methyltransferase